MKINAKNVVIALLVVGAIKDTITVHRLNRENQRLFNSGLAASQLSDMYARKLNDNGVRLDEFEQIVMHHHLDQIK